MFMRQISVTVMIVLLCAANADENRLPIVYEDNFEKGAAPWQPTDPNAWKIERTERGQVYSQFKKKSNYKPPHRSPYNLSYRGLVKVLGPAPQGICHEVIRESPEQECRAL